jgi:hypothetical protein
VIDAQKLKLGKDASGDEVRVCGHCGRPVDDAHGAQDKDHLVYMLMCPGGSITLGEWATLEEKNAQLKAPGTSSRAARSKAAAA